MTQDQGRYGKYPHIKFLLSEIELLGQDRECDFTLIAVAKSP